MSRPLATLSELPARPSSQVKNRWGEVVRQVQDAGSLAITSHSNVELVLLTAQSYQALVDTVAQLQARERSELDDLSRQFMARLDSLQHPQAHTRLERVIAARGRAKKAPVAGQGY